MANPNQFCLYKNIQKKLLEHTDMEKCIGYRDAKIRISYFRIPKKVIIKIIQEMEEMGLLERISKKNGCKLRVVV